MGHGGPQTGHAETKKPFSSLPQRPFCPGSRLVSSDSKSKFPVTDRTVELNVPQRQTDSVLGQPSKTRAESRVSQKERKCTLATGTPYECSSMPKSIRHLPSYLVSGSPHLARPPHPGPCRFTLQTPGRRGRAPRTTHPKVPVAPPELRRKGDPVS